VPFEEDERDPKTFFLDLDYVEEMWRMFRKVNGGCLQRPAAVSTSSWHPHSRDARSANLQPRSAQ
jgi:26S proteasome regulatory subunit N8